MWNDPGLPALFLHGHQAAEPVPIGIAMADQLRVTIRPARRAEAGSLLLLARRAYERYVSRLGGLEPAPMNADYAALIDRGQVWVADRGGTVVGILVLAT